jgi:hypothetical protein
MISVQQATNQIGFEPMQTLVNRLCDRMEAAWWSTETTFPELERAYTGREQRSCEAELARLLDALERGLKHAPAEESGRAGLRQQILAESTRFIQATFGLEDRQLDVVRRNGLIERAEEFAGMARRYDPAISSEDVYQASRNVSSMNLMQLLLGLPVEITPAVFAYSMIYPYTDNYLDDPAITMDTKRGFNQRFWNRLAGLQPTPASGTEERIWDLVGMVEGQYERRSYPQVYESLLAIHAAQSRSLRLLRASAAPYEVNVLRISFEKGGTSVLADGYLVAGSLSEEQAAFMFGFGAFTQLMDDLEDVDLDRQAGSMTIFSQTAGHYNLDAITNRLFHLAGLLFNMDSLFSVPDARPLQELSLKAIPPLLYFSVANFSKYYSQEYLKQMEKGMPFRSAFLRSQRKKLERNKVALFRLLEAGQ